MSESRWISAPPSKCDLCKGTLSQQFVDGMVRTFGCWAVMCAVCHSKSGVGLGTGKGQRYDLESLVKVEG